MSKKNNVDNTLNFEIRNREIINTNFNHAIAVCQG